MQLAITFKAYIRRLGLKEEQRVAPRQLDKRCRSRSEIIAPRSMDRQSIESLLKADRRIKGDIKKNCKAYRW